MRINTEIGNEDTIVLLVNEDGSKERRLGELLNEIADTDDDIIEITVNNENKSVVKIENSEKYLYKQKKHKKEIEKNNRKNRSITKSITLSRNIAEHDLIIKCKKISKIINDGNKVKIVIKFRGRENAFKNDGKDIINKMHKLIGDGSKIGEITFDKNTVSTVISL